MLRDIRAALASVRPRDFDLKRAGENAVVDKDEKPSTIALRAEFENQGTAAVDAAAYLFDRNGAFVASAPLDKGEAYLEVGRLPRTTRLFVGPALDKAEREGAPTLSTMDRLSAYEVAVKLRPGIDRLDLGIIPDFIWPHWPLCRCRVRGRVLVRRTSPGGVVVEAPVCNARVHICEVDRLPWLIERLPDLDIFRLRDDLLDLVRRPFPRLPFPEPDPRPFNDIATPTDLSRRIIGNIDLVALNPQPLPPLSRHQPDAPGAAVAFNPQPDPPRELLPQKLQFVLGSHAPSIVRRALLDNLDLIRPWICWWPWLHRWFYTSDELRTVTTDDQGRFDTRIWYRCDGDKPDLYFWVEYSIGGTWVPVHKPPIPCNIWWNYPCGTDVTITVTDPRVPGCGEIPEVHGKQIVVKTIARQVSMGEIDRDPVREGTVKAGASGMHPTREAPFGGTLEPRVDFGSGLKAAGISHYRWRYRPLGSTLDTDWISLQADVFRHYRETPAGPLAPIIYKSVQVGPDPAVSGGHFFKIDPELPAGGDEFEVLDEGYDLASAYFDTTALAPGKYETKLELFRVSGGAAVRVDLTAEGVGVNEIVGPAPLTGPAYTTAAATGDRLMIEAGQTVGYRLVLHVDNRSCFGTIDSVSVAPGANDTRCGFLEYNASSLATIVFRASHPGNYATFAFNVSRVATPLGIASASGLVDDAGANGFNRSGDQFSKSIAVTTLLSEGVVPPETPCIRAAFGESLRVEALATNGYGRLSHLDAPNAVPPGQSGLRAFAITPA